MNFEWINNLTNQDLKVIALIVVTIFIVIVILGLTDKVVVFRNVGDFAWTAAIAVIPVLGFLVLAFLMPADAPDTYNVFWDSGPAKAVTTVSGMGFVLSTAATYFSSIGSNGIVVGLLVGTFRTISAILLSIFLIGIFGLSKESKNRSHGSASNSAIKIVVFGLFAFVVRRLINGDRVHARRVGAT